jgi:LemA protein
MTPFQLLAILAGISSFTLLYLLTTYNAFIRLNNRVKTDFSDIDVQLRRRASLVQNLVDMVREYASHENKTFTKVAKARTALDNSQSMHDTAKADNMLTETLRSLVMVTEAYPELKADKNYQQIRTDLVLTENAIAGYREEYNQTVERYNNATQTFPNLLVANLFDFKEAELYQPSGLVDYQIEESKNKK